MTLSALVMGILGILLTFLPMEVGATLEVANNFGVATMLQLFGALYFAFAMLNWTARANLIGGIYGRPIAIGNLTHFVMGTLAAGKAYYSSGVMLLLPIAILYFVFAALFTLIFFTHPVQNQL